MFLVVITKTASSSSEEQCMGYDPMQSVATFMGMSLDYDLSDRICCNNHRLAEPSGYHERDGVDFYSKLDPNVETVFYDSVCGLPLFVAPRGRSFDEFVKESRKHGWPSFRPEEMVSENVIIHSGGRMESKCFTHLGHNLPDGIFNGVDRYCIDLVCIAGDPDYLSSDGTGAATIEYSDDVLTISEFNASSYISSAETRSGNHSKAKETIVIVVIVIGGIVVVAFIGQWIKRRFVKTKEIGDC